MDDPKYRAIVISDKEVQFESKRYKLSPLTRELKERVGNANESGAYQGGDHWSYNSRKLGSSCIVVGLN